MSQFLDKTERTGRDFPAPRGLDAALRRRQVPFVQQLEAADCGPACLAMVLRYWGRHLHLDEVRAVVGCSGRGVGVGDLVRAAESFKLRSRVLTIDIDDLQYLSPGAILHWEFHHFVVFEKLRRDAVVVIDPAFGRRAIPHARFRRSFTGVAVTLDPSEGFAKSRKSRSPLFDYLRALFGQRATLWRTIGGSIMLRVFGLATPLITGLIIDRVIPRGDSQLLLVLAVGACAIMMAQFATNVVRAHLLLQLRTALDTRLTLGFIDYLTALPFSFFQRRSVGDLMLRVSSNSTIREGVTSGTMSALLDSSTVVIYLVLLFCISPTFALLAASIGAVNALTFWVMRSRYRDLTAEAIEAGAKQQSYLVQMLAGIETLKSCGMEARAVERWSNLWVNELNVGLRYGRLAAIVDGVQGLISGASPLIILIYGAGTVMAGSLSLGMMLAVNALAISFLGPLTGLAATALKLQTLGSYIDRIEEVFRTEPEQEGARQLAPALTGAMSLESVSFRYDDNGELVVRDVDIEIEPGSTVALVGKSGSGKSTLARLMVGLCKPTAGRVRYQGLATTDVDLRSLRQQIGVVTQNAYVFSGTVRDNLAATVRDAPFEALKRAARIACIDTDIQAMPLQYNTPIADGGGSLSGGQRQRLALARALVHRPKVLLLDEATSALDAATEAAVIENLSKLSCTRIFIAHRLSTIQRADKILVVEDGRVVEVGTHGDLLQRRGTYAELVRGQVARA